MYSEQWKAKIIEGLVKDSQLSVLGNEFRLMPKRTVSFHRTIPI